MLRRFALWIALARCGAVGIALFCTPALAQPGTAEELERIEFTLADAHYRIMMPKGSKMRGNKPGCVQIWHPHTTRLVKSLELCSPAGPAAASYKTEATLSNGARVRYDVDYDIGGGSGGAEGELKGQFNLASRVLALTCRDQGEWGNAPSWCLSYLRTLQVQDRP